MSDVIGELKSCSFQVEVVHDVADRGSGLLLTQFVEHSVYMVGPNKMTIDSRLDSGRRGYWYDGDTMTYYSYSENNFGRVEAPKTIIAAIDAINRDYGVDFPAADFFYPTFTDDLIEESDSVQYVGLKDIDGRSCFHIVATSASRRTQLWISNDVFKLPLRYAVTHLDQKELPRYMATFSDWKLNPDLPESMFEFTPPQSANELTLVPKSKR